MGLLIASIVVFVLILIGGIILGFVGRSEGDTNKGFLVCFGALLAPVILLFGCFTKVDANEVGIIYHDRKGVLEEVKYEGFQTKSIFEHITPISTTNKTANVISTGQTSSSVFATFDMTIIYRIDKDNAGLFYKKTSDVNISETALNSIVKESLQSATINYDIYNILAGQLENVRIDFETNLSKNLLENYFITVVSVSFNDIDAGDQIEASIQAKAEAEQQVEIAEAERQKAEVEKQTALIQAQAQAEAAKILADNEAEIIRIKAQAEADKIELEKNAIADMIDSLYAATVDDAGNHMLTYSECSQIILDQIFYETWDGKLPEVMTSGDLENLLGALLTQTP